MKFLQDSFNIKTTDNKIEVGGLYDWKKDSFVCHVKLLEIKKQKDESYILKLEVIATNDESLFCTDEKIFHVKTNNLKYSNNWGIYELGTWCY